MRDIYIEALRDLWSADDQMQRILPKLLQVASEDLADLPDEAIDEIEKHTAELKSLIEGNDGSRRKSIARAEKADGGDQFTLKIGAGGLL